MKIQVIATLLLTAGMFMSDAVAGDRDTFYEKCVQTSRNDGLTEAAAAQFCGCMTDAAVKDQAIYDELLRVGTTEPTPEARDAKLTAPALAVVSGCRA